MAEQPATSDSSPETDRDFDPSADMLVNDYDDEQTLDEEEALSNEGSCSNELSHLQKEGDMPLEELLAMYGYGGGAPAPPVSEPHDTRSSSEEEILSNQDLTLDKDEIARDLMLKDDEHDKETSVIELLDSVDMPSQTVRLLRSNHASSDDEESEDDDYVPDDDWKKTINVGSDFQAPIPEGLCKYGDAPAYENEDRLLWDPYKLEDKEVEKYLSEVHRQIHQIAQGVQAIPTGIHTRDDEQALYLLLQCGHNVEEALRRRKMQAVPPTDPMSLWSEEECRNFENGLRTYGKDFYMIQQNKVRTRSVGELVQFYYLWKKTERHDVFANKTRLEKKKYILHPGVTDYMDRFLDEQENPAPIRDRSASPITSLIYGDPKRHHAITAPATDPSPADIAAALEMVQKVVDPEKVFTDIKLNPALNTAAATTASTTPTAPAVSISSEIRDKQQNPENLVHIANFTNSSASTSKDTAVAEPVPAAALGNVDMDSGEPAVKRLKVDNKKESGVNVGQSSVQSSVAQCETGSDPPAQDYSPAKTETTKCDNTPEQNEQADVCDSSKSNNLIGKVEVSISGTTVNTMERKDGVNLNACVANNTAESMVQ